MEPLVQESTPALIAKRLRHAIGHGSLAPGQQLHEVTLAKELQVSRGPLREALQRLAQEGLLVSIRNRGVFVADVTDDDVRDMYLARTAIERAAAARIIAAGRSQEGRLLMEAVEVMADAAAHGDGEALTEADIAFHSLLVELSGSSRLLRMHNTLIIETRMCISALEDRYMTNDPRVDEHRAIARAVVDKDVKESDRLLTEHMDDAVCRLVDN